VCSKRLTGPGGAGHFPDIQRAAAGPVFAAGGYPALGAASALACLLTAAIGLGFTENRVPQPDESDGSSGYAATLRAGLAEARSSRAVRRLLLLVPALAAVWGGLAEYDPLLAADTAVSVETIPLLVLLLWAGVTVGGLLTPIGRRMPPKVFTGSRPLRSHWRVRAGVRRPTVKGLSSR
jgi:hypothetical protein